MIEALSALCVFVSLGGLVLAAGYDLATFTIPNRVVAMVGLANTLAMVLAVPDISTAAQYIATGLVVLLVGAVLFALRMWGAGDAKLLAAVSLAVGSKGLIVLGLWTALSGGGLALIFLVLRRLPMLGKTRLGQWYLPTLLANNGVPYGVAIAAGGIIAFASHATLLRIGIPGR